MFERVCDTVWEGVSGGCLIVGIIGYNRVGNRGCDIHTEELNKECQAHQQSSQRNVEKLFGVTTC